MGDLKTNNDNEVLKAYNLWVLEFHLRILANNGSYYSSQWARQWYRTRRNDGWYSRDQIKNESKSGQGVMIYDLVQKWMENKDQEGLKKELEDRDMIPAGSKQVWEIINDRASWYIWGREVLLGVIEEYNCNFVSEKEAYEELLRGMEGELEGLEFEKQELEDQIENIQGSIERAIDKIEALKKEKSNESVWTN